MNDLARTSDITIGGLTLTRTGITARGVITLDDLTGAAALVSRCATACNWWVGDLLYLALVVPEAGHGLDENRAYQWIADVFPDMSEEMQQRCLSVSTAYPPSTDSKPQITRFDTLSWTHHRIASRVDGKERVDLLVDAAENDWSTSELRNEVNAVLKEPAAPERFRVHPSWNPTEEFESCETWAETMAAVRRSVTYHLFRADVVVDEFSIRVERVKDKD